MKRKYDMLQIRLFLFRHIYHPERAGYPLRALFYQGLHKDAPLARLKITCYWPEYPDQEPSTLHYETERGCYARNPAEGGIYTPYGVVMQYDLSAINLVMKKYWKPPKWQVEEQRKLAELWEEIDREEMEMQKRKEMQMMI
jgi:hypothetical protein